MHLGLASGALFPIAAMFRAEEVTGEHQLQADPGDEEWQVHTGHKDVLEVLTLWQRWA